MYSEQQIHDAVKVIAATIENRYLDALGEDNHDETSWLMRHGHDFDVIASTLGYDASNPYDVKPISQHDDPDPDNFYAGEVDDDYGFDEFNTNYVIDSPLPDSNK